MERSFNRPVTVPLRTRYSPAKTPCDNECWARIRDCFGVLWMRSAGSVAVPKRDGASVAPRRELQLSDGPDQRGWAALGGH